MLLSGIIWQLSFTCGVVVILVIHLDPDSVPIICADDVHAIQSISYIYDVSVKMSMKTMHATH